MTDTAAFRATYSDWKLIRTRKVVQVVLEIPIEQADQAYQVLGGMPDPGSSVWCAVARLKQENEPSSVQQAGICPPKPFREREVIPHTRELLSVSPNDKTPPASAPEQPARAPKCLGGSEGAGQVVPSPLMAGNPTQRAPKAFREMSYAQQAGILCADKKFWRFLTEERCDGETVRNEDDAVCVVRNICLVDSRRDIIPGSVAARAWRELVDRYRVWEVPV